MATATKKSPPPSPRPAPEHAPKTRSVLGLIIRVCEAIYRFLASLKLAVLSLAALAGTLAYATVFEANYGTAAAQEWIYKTKGFALLLAFLGINILCAALIRFPWKRRQIGFLITHAGLLVLLAGSFWSLKTADEGQVGMLEGDVKSRLVRIDHPKISVWPIDPETDKPIDDQGIELDFQPGHFAWGPGQPRPRGIFGSLAHAVTFGLFDRPGDPGEVLTRSGDPFRLVVKAHLPASAPALEHVPDPDGVPMVKIHPRFRGPGMPHARDVFEDERACWFEADRPFYQTVKSQGPAQFAFLYVDRPELVEDFLNPPRDAGPSGVARLHYRDQVGASRRYEWALDGQAGRTTTLPGSDLSVTFVGTGEDVTEADENTLERMLRNSSIAYAHFRVRQGGGPEADYYGMARMPMAPNLIPTDRSKPVAHARPLIRVDYFLPPVLDPSTLGRRGLVEVLGTPDKALYYRIFGRGETGRSEVRDLGAVTLGKEITAFGGKNMPMTITFQVEDYLPRGVEKEVCKPIVLPKGQQGNGIPAGLVAMTVQGQTREFWVRRSRSLDPAYRRISFPSGDYLVSYDVDRKDLGFQLRLDDFEVGFDPGTDQASSYTSKVRLTDEEQGIRDEPHTITMNEPLTHRGYTFYQASFEREEDPQSGRETGRFISVFQVGTDPGRRIKYAGCLMVVLGAFVQFYMRAGIFSDGGKRERERAAARARKRAGVNGQHEPETSIAVVTESEETL